MSLVIDAPERDKTAGPSNLDHGEHVEQALLQARALIESTVVLHRQRSAAPSRLARTEVRQIGDALEQLVALARHTITVALTGIGEFAEAVMLLLAGIPRQAAVRVLCAADAEAVSLTRLRQLRDPRLEIRVSESGLTEMLMVDGTAALVRSAAPMGVSPATVVNDVASVRALELLFVGAWSRGRRLSDHLELSPRLRSEITRNILERLHAGYTDELAARELNVSLRTYRRHVAEIMRELEANSRFQAGVRAVEIGLLSE